MKISTLTFNPVMTKILISFAAIITIALVYMCTIQVGDMLPALLSSVRHELSSVAYQLLYIR